MNELLRSPTDEQEETHWLSVSDLMAGLTMVFLFISIALMRDAFMERDKIKEIAVAYQENQVSIYNALNDEFTEDLKAWSAVQNGRNGTQPDIQNLAKRLLSSVYGSIKALSTFH